MSEAPVALVRVLSLDSEKDLDQIVEMLEAREIPCFVCNGRLGSVSSGTQGRTRQVRTIMVPGPRLAEAQKLIGDFQDAGDLDGDIVWKLSPNRLRARVRLMRFWLAHTAPHRL